MENNATHPQHYKLCSIECIEAMEMLLGPDKVYDFCICNAFKYIWRYKNKNGKEDLDKAIYYLEYAKNINEYAIEADNIDNVLSRIIDKNKKESEVTQS